MRKTATIASPAVRHELISSGSRQVSERSCQRKADELALLVFAVSVSAAVWAPIVSLSLDGELATGMTLMLGIMFVGAIFGTKSAIMAALLASALFVFLSDSAIHLRSAKGEGIGPLLLFVAAAAASALLSGRLHDRTIDLRLERGRLSTLVETSRRLQYAANVQALSRVLDQEVDPICAIERAQLTSILKQANAEQCSGQFRSALLGSLGHDLRTPLTVIGTAASGLLDHGAKFEPATSQAMLRTILAESRRLNRLSSQLLKLACLDPCQVAIRDEHISVTQIVSDRVHQMRKQATAHRFALHAPQGPVVAKGDGAMLDLAITNMLENAVRYSPSGSIISVSVIRRSGTCSVCVIDEGCGIETDDLPRVFDPSYRGLQARSLSPGSGLGLFIARTFVAALGGSIAVHSPVKDRRGTAVTIQLPLLQGDTPQ